MSPTHACDHFVLVVVIKVLSNDSKCRYFADIEERQLTTSVHTNNLLNTVLPLVSKSTSDDSSNTAGALAVLLLSSVRETSAGRVLHTRDDCEHSQKVCACPK
jgi:hypothetical protein